MYNSRALWEGLRRSDGTLSTEAGTDVLGHLREGFSERCANELEVIFAFAVGDDRGHFCLPFRDRLGAKAPHYAACDGGLVFGSRINELLRHRANAGKAGNRRPRHLPVHTRYRPGRRTMFTRIAALPPGHLATSESRGVRCEPCGKVPLARANPPLREKAAAELGQLRLLDESEA